MFTDFSDEIMNEILGGAEGPVENKADTAVNFLNEWAENISNFIEMVKKFFADLAAIFA